MSVKVMGRVWDADLPPNLKLVLLAYADAAEHDGTDIWPGWERIASMTGYSQPTVARLTAELKTLGVLIQVGKGHTGRRAVYRIDLNHPSMRAYQDDTQSGSESLSNDAESVSNQAESLSPAIPLPSSSSVLSSRPKKTRPRDPIWDTLVELFGPPAPRRQKLYGRVTKYLHDAGATGPDITERAAWIAANWGPEKLTITSLESHWSRFDGQVGQITGTDILQQRRQTKRNEARAAIAAAPTMSDAQRHAKEKQQ